MSQNYFWVQITSSWSSCLWLPFPLFRFLFLDVTVSLSAVLNYVVFFIPLSEPFHQGMTVTCTSYICKPCSRVFLFTLMTHRLPYRYYCRLTNEGLFNSTVFYRFGDLSQFWVPVCRNIHISLSVNSFEIIVQLSEIINFANEYGFACFYGSLVTY